MTCHYGSVAWSFALSEASRSDYQSLTWVGICREHLLFSLFSRRTSTGKGHCLMPVRRKVRQHLKASTHSVFCTRYSRQFYCPKVHICFRQALRVSRRSYRNSKLSAILKTAYTRKDLWKKLTASAGLSHQRSRYSDYHLKRRSTSGLVYGRAF